MINLIIVFLGVFLVITGVYSMSFGFSTPPNLLYFFMGLIASVFGLILVIIFGTKVDFGEFRKSVPKMEMQTAKVGLPKATERIRKAMKSEPKPKEIKPKAKVKDESIETVKKATKETTKPVKTEPKTALKITPKPKEEPPMKPGISPKPAEKTEAPPIAEEKVKKQEAPAVAPKELKTITPVKKKEDRYVKDRLSKLKEDYIKHAKDVEELIEERLDSFKGTLNQIKSESKEPTIIWSFDAEDVQEAMKDTILKAENKVLMMYPWVRNIDVGVLKKFMDLESRMIIQEASLDDDASVELIRLLLDKNVEIRTMPHVHTVTVVSDDSNGLIISTDPIYESFEVGVVYKDQRSIEEIERLFGEAWELSKVINLEENV